MFKALIGNRNNYQSGIVQESSRWSRLTSCCGETSATMYCRRTFPAASSSSAPLSPSGSTQTTCPVESRLVSRLRELMSSNTIRFYFDGNVFYNG